MSISESSGELVDAPQFGLIDLVDAFTALRHETRTQIKEVRGSSELVSVLSQRLNQIALQLEQQATASRREDAQPSRETSLLLVEFDIQWTRAVDAIERMEKQNKDIAGLPYQTFDAIVAGLGPWQRWLSKRLIGAFQKSRPSQDLKLSEETSGVASQGISILLARLRNVLRDYQIDRVETTGKAFDGQTMRSVGTVVSDSVPEGYVAEEYSPAYLQRGQALRFADVRVAVRG